MPIPKSNQKPTYTLVELIQELMGFEGQAQVVMRRDTARLIASELTRLYDIEDDYNRIRDSIKPQ